MADDRSDDLLTLLLIGEQAAERQQVRALMAKMSPARLQVVELSSDAAAEPGDPDSVPDIVAVIVGEQVADAVGWLQRWAARTPRPLLLALHRSWPLGLMREILRAGANEMVQLPPTAYELELVFLKLRESRRPRERAGATGRVYAICSLAGGVGLSTVAMHVALALKYALNRRVAILDLDLQDGGISLALHLEPTETIVALATAIARLDSIRLEGALTKHPAGIYLLAAPRKIEEADLVSDVAVGAILDLMRQLFDVVVVDCGHHVTENTVVAWERSQQVLYVTDQSLRSARLVPRFTTLFESLALRGITARLVLNRFAPGAEARREAIAEAAGMPLFATLPRDHRLLDALQLHNEDLWRTAPGSRLARAFAELARRLDAEDAAPAAPRLVARLLGAFGARR